MGRDGDDDRDDRIVRTVRLPRGATLVVRRADRDDVDGLAALFESLDPEDRYRRFFSAYRPSRTFIEKLVDVDPKDGAQLVAVVDDATNAPTIVAEAGYRRLPNGDGELAIAISPRWRGWLGPFLIDALAEVARREGVPNLEADILAANRSMLALARERGCVLMEQPDASVVRVLVGTSDTVPSWPGAHDRLRVLVEGPGGRVGRAARGRRDVQVLACPGPPNRRTPCPVLAGQRCPLVDGADVIVLSNPTDDPSWAALRQHHRTHHPATPVVADMPSDLDEDDLIEHLREVAAPPDPA